MVVLDELGLDAELAPGGGAEGLDQEAALVAVDLGLDQDEAVELGRRAGAGISASARPYWRS